MTKKKSKLDVVTPRGVRHFFADLGPGLITGAADDDPSGISTYSVTGASFGYAPLWTALFSFPLMAAVQMMCARLGMVTHPVLESRLRAAIAELGQFEFLRSVPRMIRVIEEEFV